MLIVFEGCDNSGKTTQIELLKNHLSNENKEVVVFKEPGALPGIRDILLNSKTKMDEKTELLLFSADRTFNIQNNIKPNLDKIVLLDRFWYSTIAYGVAKGYNIEWIYNLIDMTVDVVPDIVFFMNISPEESFKRIVNPDNYEKLGVSYQQKVYKNYIDIDYFSDKKFTMIDASKSIEEIHNKIVSIVEYL
jgi:dTMP kinase